MYTTTGVLNPTPPFDFVKTLAFLEGFMPTKDEQAIVQHSLTKAIIVEGWPVAFRLSSIGTIEKPQLAYTLFTKEPITGEVKDAALDRITFFLSLDDDLRPFYEIGKHDPHFEPVLQELYGYHQVKFTSPFETACWAILAQRNPMSVARKSKDAMMKHIGSSLDIDGIEYWAFPEAAQVAVVEIDELAAVIRNERKAEQVSSMAKGFSMVDEAFLRNGPYEEVEAWLRSLKGIGDWSANFIMLRGLGRMERIPISEKRLYEAVSRTYMQGKPVTAEDIQRIADRYGPYQGYWAHYVRVGS